MILNYANLVIPSRWADQKNDVEITTTTDRDAIKIDTQDKLYFTSPLVSNSSKNVNFTEHHNLGFQMVGLSFQNFKYSRDINVNNDLTDDSKIAQYHKEFKNNASYIRKLAPTGNNTNEDGNLVKYFYTAETATPDPGAAFIDVGSGTNTIP